MFVKQSNTTNRTAHYILLEDTTLYGWSFSISALTFLIAQYQYYKFSNTVVNSFEKIESTKRSLDSFETRITNSPIGTLPIGEEHKTLCGAEGIWITFLPFQTLLWILCWAISTADVPSHSFLHCVLQYMVYYHVLKWGILFSITYYIPRQVVLKS